MVAKKNVTAVLAILAIGSAILLFDEINTNRQISRYNAAIADKDYARAAQQTDEHGSFAKAYAVHQQGEFPAARAGYNDLANATTPGIATAALYNLGNTYLQQARGYNLDEDSDLAIPLFELAKISYRQALSADTSNWDARFNLEKTLILVPDTNPRVPMEVQGRRGAVRTVISADTEDNLP